MGAEFPGGSERSFEVQKKGKKKFLLSLQTLVNGCLEGDEQVLFMENHKSESQLQCASLQCMLPISTDEVALHPAWEI